MRGKFGGGGGGLGVEREDVNISTNGYILGVQSELIGPKGCCGVSRVFHL